MQNYFEIIAETAFSHEGNIDYLYNQISAAYNGRADFVKFQILLDKDSYYVHGHPSYEIIEKWLIKSEEWLDVFKYTKQLGLRILALPLNIPSLEFCLRNNNFIDAYEVHAVSFNEVYLLQAIESVNKKIILGIGGREPEEINFALKALGMKTSNIILQYGFQSFPTDETKTNLSKIKKYRDMFSCELGYADHSSFENESFLTLSKIAFMMGARYFEKHIVLKKGEKRVDYESAVINKDLLRLREDLEKLIQILGNDDIFILNEEEKLYRTREKKIVYAKDVKANNILSQDNLTYKITHEDSDFNQKDLPELIGRTVGVDCCKDSTVKYSHIKN